MPWRRTRDPYRILVSEIMLQQTQVGRVLGYYAAFLKRFPAFESLAEAGTRQVLAAWQGLGYNRRALYLKRTAETVVRKYGGKLPCGPAALRRLPGIGEGTAGAITAFAFNKPSAFIETNIRRVFIHFFFPRRKTVHDEEIIKLVKATVDKSRPREWYWALMDYGTMLGLGNKSGHSANPNRRSAHYKKQPPFSGSDRELRGKILRLLMVKSPLPVPELAQSASSTIARTRNALRALEKEGFVRVGRNAAVI